MKDMKTANTKIVGERVKELRTAKKMTQEELAKKLGYKSKSSVTHIENGRDIPRQMVATLASLLGTNPAYLMGWSDNPEPLSEMQAHLAELVEAGDPSDTTRLLMGLPKHNTLDPNNFKTLGVIDVTYKIPKKEKSPHEEDDLTDDDKKELELFAEFLRYRRSCQKGG